MKGGDVIFKFKADSKDFEQALGKLGNTAKNIAGAGLKGLTAIGVSAYTTLKSVALKTVEVQGQLEQQIGGTKAVFGQYADEVQKKAKAAYNVMGVSANDYMATINKIGSLMQGSGIDTKKAMDLSSAAMQRASDVASVMGITTEEAMRAITGAAKGNFTMMDNLGVAMNATSLNAYALEKGLKKTYQTMSQGEKVELAMQMFLEKSAYAADNYAKENKTFAGSLNTMKVAIQNLISGTGSVDQVIEAVQNFGTILAENLKTILPKVVEGIVGLINGLIPLLPELIQAVLPALIQGTVDLTIGIINVLPDIIQMLADMLPELIPQIVDAIMLIIPALIENAPQFIAAGIYFILRLLEGLWKGLEKIDAGIKQWINDLINKFIEKHKWVQVALQWVQGLWDGIKEKKQWLKDKIKSWVGDVLKFIKKLFGISSPSKEFEIIGKFNVLGLEKGMEDEKAQLEDTFNEMFDLSPSLYGSSSLNLSPTVNVVNNINMKQDSLGQMVNDIKTFSGGAKNDYSYGMGA